MPTDPHVSPEDDVCLGCYTGDHDACDGTAWCQVVGDLVTCFCPDNHDDEDER